MFKFLDDAPLECGKPAPPVLVSCMEFSHVMYEIFYMIITVIMILLSFNDDDMTGMNLPVSGCLLTTS